MWISHSSNSASPLSAADCDTSTSPALSPVAEVQPVDTEDGQQGEDVDCCPDATQGGPGETWSTEALGEASAGESDSESRDHPRQHQYDQRRHERGHPPGYSPGNPRGPLDGRPSDRRADSPRLHAQPKRVFRDKGTTITPASHPRRRRRRTRRDVQHRRRAPPEYRIAGLLAVPALTKPRQAGTNLILPSRSQGRV